MSWRDVPIPDLLDRRPKDRRGYPIPANVFIDPKGTAHFSVQRDNAARLLRERRCQLCGCVMPAGDAWFVGNAIAFFHPQAVFIDPPGHRACVEYALQVCPFMAMPNYSKRIDGATVKGDNDVSLLVVEDVVTTDGDLRVWCIGLARGRPSVTRTQPGVIHLRPERPWLELAFWRHGQEIGADEAMRACPDLRALSVRADILRV